MYIHTCIIKCSSYNKSKLILTYYLITVRAVVHRVAGHQTHAMPAAGCGEMTHCGPLVLFRVVQEHLVIIGGAVVATCRAS